LELLALGDVEAAQHGVAFLKRHRDKYGVKSQYACALGFEGQLAASGEETNTTLKRLRARLAKGLLDSLT
jgi:hypothetical protein